MKFSDKVKTVRAKLLLSQIDLAKELGISNVTINRWENDVCEPSFLAQSQFYDFCKKKGITFADSKSE